MSDKMPTQFRPADYLKGRIALPPSLYSKRQRPFVYGDDISIASGATGRLDLQIQDDSHFLVEAISIISSDQTRNQDLATVQLTESASGRSWSDKAVPLRDLAGKGDSPKYLTDPNILRPASALAVQITNNIGSTAQFYVALHGRKIYDVSKQEADFLARRQWFQYVLSVASLAASAADTTYSVQVYNDSDFIIKKILSSQMIGQIIGGTAGAESAEIMWNLRDTSSDVSLFNKKLAARLMIGQLAGEIFNNANSWGNGAGFPLKMPWLVRRNGVLEGRFDNRSSAAISSSMAIVLEGVKTFEAA